MLDPKSQILNSAPHTLNPKSLILVAGSLLVHYKAQILAALKNWLRPTAATSGLKALATKSVEGVGFRVQGLVLGSGSRNNIYFGP